MKPTLPILTSSLSLRTWSGSDGMSEVGNQNYERGSAGQHQGAALNTVPSFFSSANGAVLYQPGATPQENRIPQNSGLKARAIPRADGSGLQPSCICTTVTQGVALGWYEAGALPLRRARL